MTDPSHSPTLLDKLEALEAEVVHGLVRRLRLANLLRRFPARPATAWPASTPRCGRRSTRAPSRGSVHGPARRGTLRVRTAGRTGKGPERFVAAGGGVQHDTGASCRPHRRPRQVHPLCVAFIHSPGCDVT